MLLDRFCASSPLRVGMKSKLTLLIILNDSFLHAILKKKMSFIKV